jgi:hypothetical protein
VSKSKSENRVVCGQHMPVAAEFWRARRKLSLKNIFNAQRFMACSPQSGAHESASWRFSVFSRRKLLHQNPRSDRVASGQRHLGIARKRSQSRARK